MKYFAYGSNMDPQRMKNRKVYFSKRERAILKDHKLCFNKQVARNSKEGYANLIPKKGFATEGVLYEINDDDIKKLDVAEGYPNHYYRKTVEVEKNNGQKVKASIYFAQTYKIKDDLKPTREYLNYLKKVRDLLSENYLDFLNSFDTLR